MSLLIYCISSIALIVKDICLILVSIVKIVQSLTKFFRSIIRFGFWFGLWFRFRFHDCKYYFAVAYNRFFIHLTCNETLGNVERILTRS